MLFVDYAAVVAHTQEELQSLVDRFSQVCAHFGLSISLKKTNIVGRDTGELSVIASAPPSIPTPHWTYIDKRIGKAASTLPHLATRVWATLVLS